MQEVDCTYEVSVGRATFDMNKKALAVPAYRRLYHHLNFATGRGGVDELSGNPRLDSWRLARMEGKYRQFKSRHYSMTPFLEDYRRDVDHSFTWSGHSHAKGLSTIVLEWDKQARDHYLSTDDDKATERVYSPSGRRHNAANERQRMKAIRDRMEALEATTTNADQRLILRYARSLSPRYFKDVVSQHYQEARQVAADVDDAQGNVLASLKYIRFTQSMPSYELREDNARMYAGVSLQNLQKDVLRALCPEWVKLDLASCQAAIAAKLWDVEALYRLLSEGKSVWPVLLEGMGVPAPYWNEGKEVLKEALYSVVYGASERYINFLASQGLKGYDPVTEGWTRCTIPHDKDAVFTALPFVKEMIAARERAMKQIEREGGAMTPYGWLGRGKEDIKRFLSHMFQCYELRLIAAAYEAAETRRDVLITLLQHDGIFVDANEEDRERVIVDLQEAVATRARELDIPTRLEVES